MICTSYFFSIFPRERKVCIAKWPPRYWTGPRARLFAPEDPRAVNWRAAYRKNLESRFPTPESLERYLGSVLALTPEPILCCYEADASQCHRRILAAYLKEMLGLDVPEWRETSLEQGSLL